MVNDDNAEMQPYTSSRRIGLSPVSQSWFCPQIVIQFAQRELTWRESNPWGFQNV